MKEHRRLDLNRRTLMTSSPRRRKLLIGIGLLVFVTGAATIAVLAPHVVAARRQSQIVGHIHALGGKVKYDSQDLMPAVTPGWLRRFLGVDSVGTVIEVDLSHGGTSDQEFELLRQLPSMKRLGLYDTAISDAELEHVGKMEQLESLWLDKTSVTDRGMQHLTALKNLKELLVQHTAITDDAATSIAQLRGLRKLAVAKTKITDVGVARLGDLQLESIKLDGTQVTDACGHTLARMKSLLLLDLSNSKVSDDLFGESPPWTKLQFLRIHQTAISDKCIPALSRLSSLQAISLGDTRVTAEGAAALQKAVPGCRIFR